MAKEKKTNTAENADISKSKAKREERKKEVARLLQELRYLRQMKSAVSMLLFRQDLASTAKSVRKRTGCKKKSICEANFAWIFTCYWNGVNSNVGRSDS